jgi:hypothetical protein
MELSSSLNPHAICCFEDQQFEALDSIPNYILKTFPPVPYHEDNQALFKYALKQVIIGAMFFSQDQKIEINSEFKLGKSLLFDFYKSEIGTTLPPDLRIKVYFNDDGLIQFETQ